MILIAEIGNCHLGDFDKAKELVRLAKESGADIVKSKAYFAENVNGTMPFAFYKQCEFTQEEYLELIHYAKTFLDIDLFYTVYSRKLYPMTYHQKYHKLPASDVRRKPSTAERMDMENLFVAIPELCPRPNVTKAQVLYVSEYTANNPHLENIDNLREYYKRLVGYSDHTRGIEACVKAAKYHSAHIVEKHFTLDKNIQFDGIQLDESVHGLLPNEFEELARAIK